MITFRVLSGTRRSASSVNTLHFRYIGDDRQVSRVAGAEWEEVEFATEDEEKPVIQVANVVGNAFLMGQPRLILNNPELFGTFAVGDRIPFAPLLQAPSGDLQSSPSRIESEEGTKYSTE